VLGHSTTSFHSRLELVKDVASRFLFKFCV
jgi:hypothetical protein